MVNQRNRDSREPGGDGELAKANRLGANQGLSTGVLTGRPRLPSFKFLGP